MLEHNEWDAFSTATCVEGHAILIHEPCGSMIVHEAAMRLSYVTRAADSHAQVCQAVNQVGKHRGEA